MQTPLSRPDGRQLSLRRASFCCYLSASEQSNLGKQLLSGLIKCTGSNRGKNHTGSSCGGECNPAYTGNLPQHKARSEGTYWTADSDGEQICAQKRHRAADNKTEYHLYNNVEDIVRTKHHTQHAGQNTGDNVTFKAEAGADEYGDRRRQQAGREF